MNISERIIPVWSFDKGSWYRTDDLCSLFDNIVHCHDKSYRCTSAEDILGVKCYYIQKDGLFRLFDFSASHICRKQLKRLEYLCRCS